MDEPRGKDRAFDMAVRHEVENLIRRGNIFYWRARVPAAFVHFSPAAAFHPAFAVPTIERRRSSAGSGTATNRERATSKMLEGRAAALLDIDERKWRQGGRFRHRIRRDDRFRQGDLCARRTAMGKSRFNMRKYASSQTG